jgi:hypothetical protein
MAVISSDAWAVTIRTVAIEGGAAPGIISGGVFADAGDGVESSFTFQPPTFDDDGRVAFFAYLGGTAVTSANNTGIFLQEDGQLTLVASEGATAPHVDADTRFQRLVPPQLDAGRVTFAATLRGGRFDGLTSLWVNDPDGLKFIARQGAPASDVEAGVNFGFLSNVDVNELGQVTFGAFLSDGRGGIWSDRGGDLHLIAMTRIHAPGTPDGVIFQSLSTSPLLNDNGEVAFTGRLDGPGVKDVLFNRDGLWSDVGGQLHLVARTGSPAPGVNAANFFSVALPSFDSHSLLTFHGRLIGDGIDTSNDEGYWREQGGELHLVAYEGSIPLGTQAPGATPGVRFSSIRGLSLVGHDYVQIAATVTGSGVDATNDEGLWIDRGDGLQLLLREGMPAPGVDEGLKIAFGAFTSRSFNDSGQMAFMGRLSGPGVDQTNDLAIWVEGAHGLDLIARTGQRLEVAPGDLRTIASFAANYQFNNQGQVAFLANFTDGGSGIFVAGPSSVPEPGAGGIFCLIAAPSILRNRAAQRRRTVGAHTRLNRSK